MAVSRRGFAAEALFELGGVRVLCARLDAEPDRVAALAAWLSPDELERAGRCHFERDRSRFIVARAFLRELLGECLGVAPDAVELASGDCGKPLLGGAQRNSGWQFNHSRSEGLGLYALSPAGRVGIDVEALREVRGAEEIAAHCFSRYERAAYRLLAPEDKPLGFLSCWTRKEAFVKAIGAGMSYSYDRFDVALAPHEPARLLRVDELRGEAVGWRLEAFAPQPGFVAALVCERGLPTSRT